MGQGGMIKTLQRVEWKGGGGDGGGGQGGKRQGDSGQGDGGQDYRVLKQPEGLELQAVCNS